MSRLEGIRTVGTTFGGLLFLLALGYLSATLAMPVETTGNLAWAGMGMVLGLAGKGSVEVWAKRPPALLGGSTSTTVSVQAAS